MKLNPKNTTEENEYVTRIMQNADNCDLENLYQKGALYDTGDYIEKDAKKASALFKEAADKGHAHSMWIHSCELLWGLGSYPQNIEKGLLYLERAIQHKSGEACITKAGLYYKNEFGFTFDEVIFNKLREMAREYDDTTYDPYA